MEDQLIIIYCICADLLEAMRHPEEADAQMNDAEVLTTALTAALYFRGNYETARMFLQDQHYIPDMLSKSRFNRRLNRLEDLVVILFYELAQLWKHQNEEDIDLIDSFPIAACDNYRIPRARLYKQEVYRGKITSKRRFFYGLRLHLMVTEKGHPVEFFFTPGSCSDVTYMKAFAFDLDPGSRIYADRGYNDYDFEDLLATYGITLLPMRKKNSKRALPPWICYLQHRYRKQIETTGSMIERLLPKSIHAVTARGFELKVALFVIACSLQGLFS